MKTEQTVGEWTAQWKARTLAEYADCKFAALLHAFTGGRWMP